MAVLVNGVGAAFRGLDGEGGHVKDLEGAVLESSLNFGDLLSGAGRSGGLVQLGAEHSAVHVAVAPVRREGLAGQDVLQSELEVRAPVAGGGDQGAVRRGRDHGDVVAYARNAGSLAGSRSAGGVGVLGDEHAAGGDQGLSSFLLQREVAPGVGELDVHGHARADAAGAQEESGVAGLHLFERESADVADAGGVRGDLAGLDHLVELHARHDAGHIARLVDGGEEVVGVFKAGVHRAGAGGMAELDVRILLSGEEHIGLMAEGVGEDHVAALLGEVNGGLVGGFGLRGVVLVNDAVLADAQRGQGLAQAVDVVGGVAFVLVADADQTDGDLFSGDGGQRAGADAQQQAQGEHKAQKLLHICFPPYIIQ